MLNFEFYKTVENSLGALLNKPFKKDLHSENLLLLPIVQITQNYKVKYVDTDLYDD